MAAGPEGTGQPVGQCASLAGFPICGVGITTGLQVAWAKLNEIMCVKDLVSCLVPNQGLIHRCPMTGKHTAHAHPDLVKGFGSLGLSFHL